MYTTGICKYTAFCFEINQPLIPVCEDTQMLFVTCLAQHNLSYATMQVYLSAVRYSGIISAKTTTLRTPRLNYILKGICKESAVNHQPRDRWPITFPIMEHCHMALLQHPGNYSDITIWVACCMAYSDSSELVIHHTIPRPFWPYHRFPVIGHSLGQPWNTDHCKNYSKESL